MSASQGDNMKAHSKSITIERLYALNDESEATDSYGGARRDTVKTVAAARKFILESIQTLTKDDEGREVLYIWNDLTGKKCGYIDPHKNKIILNLPNWKR